jgi:hypothetical protein
MKRFTQLLLSHANHANVLMQRAIAEYSFDQNRARGWSSFERKFLEGKSCAACGTTQHLVAHHITPYYMDALKELDESNLIPLCMTMGRYCHLHIGHGGDFMAYNPHVVADAVAVARSSVSGSDIIRAATCSRKYSYESSED